MIPLLALVLTVAPTHRYALVVGSNVGEGVKAAALHFADDDAVAMHELLLEAGVESVLLADPDSDTRRLHPKTAPLAPPTLDALRGAFAAQRASMLRAHEAGERVEWLFFFSGHGDVDRGVGFLGLASGRITRSFLHEELLARVPAERSHVVLDACRSGSLVGSKGPGGLRLPMPAAFVSEHGWGQTTGFVVSASSAKESHEWDQLQAGVFSYEVRSALRGAADTDRDGSVSYAELGAFLNAANRAIENPRLRPEFLTLPPQGKEGLGEPLLTWTDPGVTPRVAEHTYVERPNGERLLDVPAGLGQDARLHVPAERPLFLRTADESRELVLSDDRALTSSWTPSPSLPAKKGATQRALDALFGAPFSPADVEAYSASWTPPELATLVVAGPPPAAWTGRTVALVLVGTGLAAGVGGVLSAWALQRDTSALDHRTRLERNQSITALNGVSVGGWVLAGVAAVAWSWLTLKWELPAFALGPSADGVEASMSFSF